MNKLFYDEDTRKEIETQGGKRSFEERNQQKWRIQHDGEKRQVSKNKHERHLGDDFNIWGGMTLRQGLQGRKKELGKGTGFCGGEGKLS